jgi:hypothetical protein
VKTPRKVDGLKCWVSKPRVNRGRQDRYQISSEDNAAAVVAATAVPEKGLLSDTAKPEGDGQFSVMASQHKSHQRLRPYYLHESKL